MKTLLIISNILILIIIPFGIFKLIPSGLKEIPTLILTLLFVTTIFLLLFQSKRSKISDLLAVILILISSIDFSNFICDLIVQPNLITANCSGNEIADFNWVKGFFIGPVLTLFISYFYLKQKSINTIIHKVSLIFFLIILMLSYFKSDITISINNFIHQTSKPNIQLPKDCN